MLQNSDDEIKVRQIKVQQIKVQSFVQILMQGFWVYDLKLKILGKVVGFTNSKSRA